MSKGPNGMSAETVLRVEQHLLWRYGPCWRDVIDVVETVRHATPEQIERLDASWDAAVDASWDAAVAAEDAAVAAARNTAWDAAVDAAEDAAVDAAVAATVDAAVAAAVADLIGSHGYTREHHDALVAPYVAVFGDPWEGR